MGVGSGVVLVVWLFCQILKTVSPGLSFVIDSSPIAYCIAISLFSAKLFKSPSVNGKTALLQI